jgi:hypothetical protein
VQVQCKEDLKDLCRELLLQAENLEEGASIAATTVSSFPEIQPYDLDVYDVSHDPYDLGED